MSTAEDPFDAVHRDVQAAVATLHGEYASWQSGQLPLSTLRDRLRALDWDLQDLDEAVSVAHADPGRFSLSTREVGDRRLAVTKLRSDVLNIDQSVAKAENAAAAAEHGSRRQDLLVDLNSRRDETSSLGARADSQAGLGTGGASGSGAGNGYEDEVVQQEVLVQEQDQGLEDLHEVVQRIGNMGQEMNLELTEQGDMLDDLESGFDNTRSRMSNIQSKLDSFISETSRGQICTIAILFFAFIVLTFLVFAT